MKRALISLLSILLASSACASQPTTKKTLEQLVTTIQTTTTRATQPTTKPEVPLLLKIKTVDWKPKDLTDIVKKYSKPWFYFNESWDKLEYLSNNYQYVIRPTYLLAYQKGDILGNYIFVDLENQRLYSIDLDDQKLFPALKEPKIINPSNDKKILYSSNDNIVIADLEKNKKHIFKLTDSSTNVKLTDKNGNLVVQRKNDAYVSDLNLKQLFHKESCLIKTFNEDASVLILENLPEKTYSRCDIKANQDLHIWFSSPRSFFSISPNGRYTVSAFNYDPFQPHKDPVSFVDIYIHPYKLFNIRRIGKRKPLGNFFIIPTRVNNQGFLGVIQPGLYRTNIRLPDYEFIFSLEGKIPELINIQVEKGYPRKEELRQWQFEVNQGRAQKQNIK